MASEELPEDLKHIFSPEETQQLGAEASIGDALNSIGAHIMSPDEVDDMWAAMEEHRKRFPFALSLDGFSIPRPASWVQTKLEDDEPPSPSAAELIEALPAKKRHGVQLNQWTFANLDEAIAVGQAFPSHNLYWDLQRDHSGPSFKAEYSESASIVGLTVVRLLVRKEAHAAVAAVEAHAQIDQKNLYSIYDGKLLAYDFARAAGNGALMLFEPDKKLAIPPLNRAAFEELIQTTYYTLSGETNNFARSIAAYDPASMLALINEQRSVATQQELLCARFLIKDASRKAAAEGASPDELQGLQSAFENILFGQANQ